MSTVNDVRVTSGWIWDSDLLSETALFEIRRLLNALILIFLVKFVILYQINGWKYSQCYRWRI